MKVSWNWLKEYLRLDMSVEVLADRLMMAGLNLESISEVNGDLQIDLEVTSNRPDCQSHLGIAREASVLFEKELTIPAASPPERGPPATGLTQVSIAADDLCPAYIARVVQGVRVGESPHWLRRRLETIGVRPVNNVVDVTNYVLMECGQPLHAFDYDRLDEHRIVVRRAAAGEKLTAIDQREYLLSPEMCIIADARRPVAIAGVMGGLETEISAGTRNVLIETAEFTPRTVRSTARKLRLHSDSSYRFERGINRAQLDWASRRCAELILDVAGGVLCAGKVVAGSIAPEPRSAVRLRFSQIARILGVEIPGERVTQILRALGLEPVAAPDGEDPAGAGWFVPPTWRRDLEREIDLIEEAARITGYEVIPEDAVVPLAVSSTTPLDRVTERVARVLTGAGFYEAVTLSFVPEIWPELFAPWGQTPALRIDHDDYRHEVLRQSLVPSLLQARRQNERHGQFNAALFEMAHAYLQPEPDRPSSQPLLVSAVSSRVFVEMKGVLEGIADAAAPGALVETRPARVSGLAEGRAAEVLLGGQRWGWLGEISRDVRDAFELRDSATVFELDLAVLLGHANLTPEFRPLPDYPAIERDLNFVLAEEVSWQELAEVIQKAAGAHLEGVVFASQYRGPQIPADAKSYVARLSYRAADRTLTAEEVDAAQLRVVAACSEALRAVQR